MHLDPHLPVPGDLPPKLTISSTPVLTLPLELSRRQKLVFVPMRLLHIPLVEGYEEDE